VSLRILFLTPWYPDAKTPHHGVFVRDQASTIAQKFRVTLLSSKVDYATFKLFSWRVEESVFQNIREYRLVVSRSIPVFNQFNYLLISIWVGYKIAKHFKPDVIHGNIAYPGGIWSYCLSRLISRPYVVSDHTSRFTDNFRTWIHKILTVFSMKRAKHVVAVSTYSGRKIERHLQRRVDIVPNLIHVEQYTISTVQDRYIQIGFLGGLSSDIHRKGLDVLLKAVSRIQKDFVLHIGGAGKFLEYYKELAHKLGVYEKCRFHGFVDSVPDFMGKLHFFVSSSRIEAFGMVIAEAMASGLPVVATASGGPADFVDEECGVIVPNEDTEQLEKAIAWMIDEYKNFDRNKIRLKVWKNLSSEAFLKRIDALYRNFY
jgi:glycosyltransferase involved in cell wall biosynthesis